jgi:GxxExxY protein
LKRQEVTAAQSPNEPSAETDRLAREVIGAAIEVHRALGPGFSESIYESALCLELTSRNIPYVRQPAVAVDYKGTVVGEGRLDLWVGRALVVELKAIESVAPWHSAQVLAYLRATRCKLGLLINFNVPTLKQGISRIINPYD